MGKRDRMREFIINAIECYNTAADPPCIDYARNTEPVDRADYIPTNRGTLLRIGIDVKYIIQNYTKTIPEKRAETLLQWIAEGKQYIEYNLSDYQQVYLKADRKALKFILKDKGYQ